MQKAHSIKKNHNIWSHPAPRQIPTPTSDTSSPPAQPCAASTPSVHRHRSAQTSSATKLTGYPRHFQECKKYSLRRRRRSLLLLILIAYNPDVTTTSCTSLAFASHSSTSISRGPLYSRTRANHIISTDPFLESHPETYSSHSVASLPRNRIEAQLPNPSRWHQRYHRCCSTLCSISDSITAVVTDTGSSSQQPPPPSHRHPRNHITDQRSTETTPTGTAGAAGSHSSSLSASS